MVFNTGAALLDAIVLAVVSKEQQGTYGYKITQDVRQALEVSESTLYPVLRRLQKDGCLEVYDMRKPANKQCNPYNCKTACRYNKCYQSNKSRKHHCQYRQRHP